MADPREIYMARKDRWLPRAIATLVVGGLIVVALLASIAYVPAGHLGGLTRFGLGTGRGLAEGAPLVFSLKRNHPLGPPTAGHKKAARGPAVGRVLKNLCPAL